MGAINLPVSLDQMFNDLGDRISRVETGYSSPQASADAAQGTAVQASTQATQAIAQATLSIQYANDAISQATYAIATADSASAQAIQASLQAGQAQTSANGKNTSHYSTSGPSGVGTDGDLWFQTDSGGTVLYQFIYKTATGWTSAPISNSVIANLDAGKINAGVITGIAYNNGSGTFAVTAAGALTATSATITGNITATSGTFTGTVYASSGTFTGAVYASSGTFTGSLYSSDGTIGGWNIGSSSLYTGSSPFSATTYLSSSGAAGFAGTITSISPLNISHASGYSYITSLQIGSYMQIVGGYGVTSSWSPQTDNTYNLGISGSLRWSHIYANNTTVTTSDARLKTNVETASLGLDFINSLRPVSYQWIVGSKEVVLDENKNPIVIGQDANGKDIYKTIDIPGKRTHWGFLAQEVKEAIDKSGIQDFAGWVQDDLSNSDSFQSLSYEQFISPLTKAIQELSTRLDKLEGK